VTRRRNGPLHGGCVAVEQLNPEASSQWDGGAPQRLFCQSRQSASNLLKLSGAQCQQSGGGDARAAYDKARRSHGAALRRGVLDGHVVHVRRACVAQAFVGPIGGDHTEGACIARGQSEGARDSLVQLAGVVLPCAQLCLQHSDAVSGVTQLTR